MPGVEEDVDLTWFAPVRSKLAKLILSEIGHKYNLFQTEVLH